MALLGILGMSYDKQRFADFDKAPSGTETGQVVEMKMIDGRWYYTLDGGLSWIYMDKREPNG